MLKQTTFAMTLAAVMSAGAIPQAAMAGSGSNAFVGGLLGGALGSAATNTYYNKKRERQEAAQRSYSQPQSSSRTVYKKKQRAVDPVYAEGVRVQRALQTVGYYNGPLDGKLDSYDSRASIMQYQSRYRLLQTGVLQPDVKGVLLQQRDIAELAAHLHHAGDTPRDKARRLQAALKVQGFYTSKIDGSFGPKSRASLRLYQQANSMIPSGALLPEQENELVAASVQLLQNQQTQTEQVMTQVAARYSPPQQVTPVQTAPIQQQPVPGQVMTRQPVTPQQPPVEQQNQPDIQQQTPAQAMPASETTVVDM